MLAHRKKSRETAGAVLGVERATDRWWQRRNKIDKARCLSCRAGFTTHMPEKRFDMFEGEICHHHKGRWDGPGWLPR